MGCSVGLRCFDPRAPVEAWCRPLL